MSTPTTSYRLASEQDASAIRRLWEGSTDWGDLTDEQTARLTKSPWGDAITVVAVDEGGQVVGQTIFMPREISVDGQIVVATRPAAVIVSRELRGLRWGTNPSDWPGIAMGTYGVSILRERGVELRFMIPHPHWIRLLRMFDTLQGASFPLWSLPVGDPLPADSRYEALPLTSPDGRIDNLWAQASRLYRSQLVRDRRWLEWKMREPKRVITGVERDGTLVGVAVGEAWGDRQWLISDVLTADNEDSLLATLVAGYNAALGTPEAERQEFNKVGVLATPPVEAAVRGLGFQRDQWDFPLWIERLSDDVDQKAIAPEHWYIGALD